MASELQKRTIEYIDGRETESKERVCPREPVSRKLRGGVRFE